MKDLPTGWEKVKLSVIIECLDNKRVPLNIEQRYKIQGDIPYYGANGELNSINQFIFNEELLLLAEDGGSWGKKERCTYIIRGKSWVNNHAHVLRMKKSIDITYLMHFLNYSDLNKYITGSTRGKLNRKSMEKIEVTLPPLPTQKKIAIILEKAERLKEWRKEADRLTDEFLKSTFLEMFEDPVKNPMGWEIKRIQDVILSMEAGWSANGELRARKTNEYAVLKISAVTSGTFLPNEHKVINNLSELKKIVYPEKGDVIFSRANTRELVGATCLIMHDYPFLLLPDKLWKIKVDKKKICSEYLKFILSHPAIRGQISNKSTGTSGSMFNISMSKLKSIQIVIPPLELQAEFASIVYQVEHMREHQSQSKQQIDDLFNALMQKAFKGELTC